MAMTQAGYDRRLREVAPDGVPAEPTRKKPRQITPLVAVPKPPTRLIDFLRKPTVTQKGTIHEQSTPGGLKDAGGDLKGDSRQQSCAARSHQ